MPKLFAFISAIKPAKFTMAKKITLLTAISLIAVGSLFAFKTVSHSQSVNGPANKKLAQHSAQSKHGSKQATTDTADKKSRHAKLQAAAKAEQAKKQAAEQARKKQADEQAAQQQAQKQAEQQAQQQAAQQQAEQQAQQQAAQQQAAEQQAAEQQAAQPAAPQAAPQPAPVGYTVSGYSSASSAAIQGIIDSNLTAWVSISDMSTAGGVAVFGHTDFAGRPSAGAWVAGASVGEIVTVSGTQYRITNKYIVNYSSDEEYDAVYGAQPGELVFITCATYDQGTVWILRTQRI